MNNFKYTHEDSIPEDLLCGICSLPFIDPVEHESISSCSQIYCKKCTQNQKLCPHCRNNVGQWIPMPITPTTRRLLFNPLQELKVLCPHCSKEYSRGYLSDHLNGCELG